MTRSADTIYTVISMTTAIHNAKNRLSQIRRSRRSSEVVIPLEEVTLRNVAPKGATVRLSEEAAERLQEARAAAGRSLVQTH